MNFEDFRLQDLRDSSPSGISYGGSEIKDGIVLNSRAYMVKYPKVVNSRESFNCISEFIGSHIFSSLGLKTHNTLLGITDNKIVVLCEDFVHNTGYELVDFFSTGESSYDICKNEFREYTYENVISLLSYHSKYSGEEDLEEFFWKLYVVDALLGNFDRHGMNWAFLRGNGDYILAPIYDNGSCLFPRLQDNELSNIMSNEDELKVRTYTFPTSQLRLGTKKSSYFDVISSNKFTKCTAAVKWLLECFNKQEISDIIMLTPGISNIRKEFYNTIIEYRFNHLFTEVK